MSAVVATALAMLLAGATGGSAAHGASRTVSLTVALGDSNPTAAALKFADAVRRLSNGSMIIVLRPRQGAAAADSEQLLVRDVRQGTVAMGWIPTRVWDTQGLATFTALQAPFLITDYSLLKRVLRGAVGQGMLAGTRGLGVRTLALAAEDLRTPLGARRPFVGLVDFQGAKLSVTFASKVSSATLVALGATPAMVAPGPELTAALREGTVDGAETSLRVALANGYYEAATYVTPNLVLFPRVDAISINERAFQALTAQLRSILQKAAAQTTERSFAGLATRDQEQLRLLCLAGMKAASSTKAQLAALLGAEQPVYTMLKRDRATARRIAQIQELKKATPPAAPLRVPAGCAA